MISPTLAQAESLTRTLTVTGEGTESVQTTLAQVRLGVEVEGNTAEEAQREAARRSSSVVELLRSRNVSRLETTGINLSPRYDHSGNQRRLVGYTATNMVSFRVPTDQAGPLLDEAVRAGASRIDGLAFIAEDAALNRAQQQALREATQAALTQADSVLAALGLNRGDVINIQVNGATPPPPQFARTTFLRESAEFDSTPVVGGEQEVRASVTLQISY